MAWLSQRGRAVYSSLSLSPDAGFTGRAPSDLPDSAGGLDHLAPHHLHRLRGITTDYDAVLFSLSRALSLNLSIYLSLSVYYFLCFSQRWLYRRAPAKLPYSAGGLDYLAPHHLNRLRGITRNHGMLETTQGHHAGTCRYMYLHDGPALADTQGHHADTDATGRHVRAGLWELSNARGPEMSQTGHNRL